MPVNHYENFPVASWLLPGKLRRPIEIIYAFARTADDFADEGDIPAAERLQQLDAYRQELDRIAANQAPTQALFHDIANIIAEYALPIQLFRDLLDVFSQDVIKSRYANFDEVLDYCRRSANPIGRLLLHLYGAASPQNLRHSDAICSALQLINFWQDVAIDWKKNRVYLPQDEMLRYGVSDRDIAMEIDSSAWQQLIRFQCIRSRQMIQSGAPLTRALRGRIGWELRFVISGGLRILDKIEAVNGDVFRHRPLMSKWDWIGSIPRAFTVHNPV